MSGSKWTTDAMVDLTGRNAVVTGANTGLGQYYGPDGIGEARGNPKVVGSSSRSHDVELQRALWEKSTELTGVDYPV